MDIPSWAPASVGAAAAAAKKGASDGDLGDAWERLLETLAKAANVVGSPPAPGSPVDRQAAYRHLLVLLGLGIDEALRSQETRWPRLRPGNVDNVFKWGMDCPDAAYLGCALRAGCSYMVHGNRGTVRYLGFQSMGGMQTAANIVADDLRIGPDGWFEVRLSPEPADGNWMSIPSGGSSLVVRQFFYDWSGEEPARLEIEKLSGPEPDDEKPGDGGPKAKLTSSTVDALSEFVESSLKFWMDIEEAGRGQGVNTFRPPSARTDMGGAAENVTVWGSWQVEQDQALVIEVTPPPALYWSVSLGNYWWETIDYANHQSSLNGYQATIDEDGIFRAVVSQFDPGVANWLDPAGHSCGPAIFRWLRSMDEPPVPMTNLVDRSELDRYLPPSTARLDAAGRRRVVDERRFGVARRFPR